MVKKITLKNGLRILLVPQKDSLSVMVRVLVSTGSEYETKNLSGISHFLEHMCFKGTKKRPKPIDIAKEFDGIGAINNAFTSRENTGYFAKVRLEHLDKALDLLSDIYLNQIFDKDEMEKEKGVVIEEINMYEDIPSDKIWDIYLDLIHGDQPAGWAVLGTKESVKNISKKDLINYHKKYYVADSTIIVVAGGFDENEAVKKIEKYFGHISKSPKIKKPVFIKKQNNIKIKLTPKKIDQTHFIMGFPALTAYDDKKYILNVLADILGGGMSSRLFQKVREQMGAAYYIGATHSFYTDHGEAEIYGGVDNKKFIDVAKAVSFEIKKIKTKKITKAELEKAKEHIIGGFVLSLETPSQFGGFYGSQEVALGKYKHPEEIISQIQSVSAEQIQGLANEIFKLEKLNLVAIGPFKEGDEKKLKQIINF